MKNILKNQSGMAHLAILVIAVILVVGAVGVYVFTQRDNERDRTAQQASQADDAKPVNVDSEDQAEAKPVETPAETTPTSKPSSSKLSTTTVKPTPPEPQGTISISNDGCYVTATTKAALTFTVGAYATNKGGSQSYSLAANQSMKQGSGGFKNMTAYGELKDSAGNRVAKVEKAITADNCHGPADS